MEVWNIGRGPVERHFGSKVRIMGEYGYYLGKEEPVIVRICVELVVKEHKVIGLTVDPSRFWEMGGVLNFGNIGGRRI